MKHAATTSVPTIADLWRTLRAWLADALRRTRGPAAVAKLITRKAQDAAARRIALIESLLLKLLLIEAASLHPFPGRRAASSPGPINTGACERGAANAAHRLHASVSLGPGLGAARQSGDGCEEDPARPETWRVRFHPRLSRFIARQPGRRSYYERRTQPRPVSPTRARRLARRLEALRRVIANPRRAVAALARTLRARGAAARPLAQAIAWAWPREVRSSPVLACAIARAIDVHTAFNDSG